MTDGALWVWWCDGHREQAHAASTRQPRLDVLELGVDAAAGLTEPDGGVGRLLGYRTAPPRPPALTDALARIEASPPNLRRPRLRVV